MNKIKLKNIQFLMPAVVTYLENGVEKKTNVSVDMPGRCVVLGENSPPEVKDLFFPFMDGLLYMDPGSFEADEEVYQHAEKARSDYEKAQQDYVGREDE
jgi:hypothetical protein